MPVNKKNYKTKLEGGKKIEKSEETGLCDPHCFRL